MKRVIKWILSTVAALFVAVSFIGAGLAVCALPDMTTRVIAENTSNAEASPFTKDQLATMAVATKQYTVNVHDREQLDAALLDINGGRDTSKLTERYVLPEEAVGHLDDVHTVLVRVGLVFACIAFVAILLGVLCGLWKGMFLVGDMLVEAGIIAIAIMASCVITAVVNFNALFEFLHSFLFEAGSWTFSADSLLICMYPQGFWMTMGGVWVGTTGVLSILAVVLGIILRNIGKRKQQVPYPFAQPGYDILYY